jgi:hypothetical protein
LFEYDLHANRLPLLPIMHELDISIARIRSCGRLGGRGDAVSIPSGLDGYDDGHQHGRDDSGSKAIVVQVESRVYPPTLKAADECTNPATMPQCQPKCPAIGASVVPNSAASVTDGSGALHGLARDPTNTPAMTGTMFFGCLPYAENPTMVNIAPITGPLRSPRIWVAMDPRV